MELFLEVTKKLLTGFGLSVEIFFITLLFSLPLGLLVMLGSRSRFRPLSAITKTFVWIIRGTPLMLQIFVVFYGPGLAFGAKMLPRMTAVFIAFIINYACYFSEIYRGGVEAIPRGQQEAAQVLGMSKTGAFFRVVLLQVVKRILPAMGNEIITLVKDTALANVIAIKEVTMSAKEFISSAGIIWPLFYSGAFYLLFCGLVTILMARAEKRLDYFKV